MKITDEMVTRARTVFAAQGPVPSNAVIRQALLAALAVAPAVRSQRGKGGTRKSSQALRPLSEQATARAVRENERNKRLVEAGETFAGHKAPDFRRR